MSRYTDPFDKIVNAIAERANYFIWYYRDGMDASPIERIIAAAIECEKHCNAATHSFDDIQVHYEKNVGIEKMSESDGTHVILHVARQVKILSYTADFVVYAPRGKGNWSKLVVECDGHDFHERTKEQAAHDRARDRAMQEAGYTVYRFTGSEIYRDPVKCAQQVIAWADKETFG